MSRRIAEVREVSRLYDRALHELSTRAEGTHWRQQRLFRLWGRQPEDAEQGSRIARETLHTLEQLRRELLGLRDSRLYGAIPVRAQVPGTLRRTNILLNDPHYREVARLWMRRERAAQSWKLSPTEQLERQREFHAAFEAFGVRLTCHALKDFGFVPRDAEVPRCGRPPAALRLPAVLSGTQCSPEAIARLLDLARLPRSGRCSFHRKPPRRASIRPDPLGAQGGEQLVLL